MSLDLDPVIEVVFETIFQCYDIASFGRFSKHSHLEQSLIHEFVVIVGVLFASMVQVHLQGK